MFKFVFESLLCASVLIAGILPQCQNQSITNSRFFMTKPSEDNMQVWITIPERSKQLLARVECMDCDLTDGYYKSQDMGNTWEYLRDYKPKGSDFPLSFGAHPMNPNIIYRIVTEKEGEQKQWLLERTNDGGHTWNRCTAVWKKIGISIRWFTDIRYNPVDPHTIYAAVTIPGEVPESRFLFVSKDSGETFSFLLGDVFDLDICQSKPEIMYVVGFSHLVQRSSNGGRTWELIGQMDGIRKQYISIDGTLKVNGVYAVAINPNNCNIVYLLTSIGVLQSTNGGISWCVLDLASSRRYTPSSIAFDPDNSRRILIGTSDRGLFGSEDGGCTWNNIDISKRIRR